MEREVEKVRVNDFLIGPGEPLTFIVGPCVIENERDTLYCAEKIRDIKDKLGLQIIFKACYDKANRLSYDSFRGPGIDEGLRILNKVKEEFGLPVVSDVHDPEEATISAQVLDIIQIPAFLCRQTDLVVSAAKTMKPLHIKKGQFVAPQDMGNIVEKARSAGNRQVILADRGATFGYNNLVSDMRALPIMRNFGVPVSFDVTHSVQIPGGKGTFSGGNRDYIPMLARAAVATGFCDLIFIETHPKPEESKSDSAVVYPLDKLQDLISSLVELHEFIHKTNLVCL